MIRSVVVVALASLLVVSCSKEPRGSRQAPGAGTNLPPPRIALENSGSKGGPGMAIGEGATTGGPDTSFKLAVATPPAGPAGTEAVARVSVTPTEGWHMNKEYPTKLKVTAPDGVQLAKAVFEVGDVTKLDDNELAFDIKLVAAKAGTYKVDGEIKFAVCTPETCDPKKQPIAFDLVVQ
jgi:hypothetical protein